MQEEIKKLIKKYNYLLSGNQELISECKAKGLENFNFEDTENVNLICLELFVNHSINSGVRYCVPFVSNVTSVKCIPRLMISSNKSGKARCHPRSGSPPVMMRCLSEPKIPSGNILCISSTIASIVNIGDKCLKRGSHEA